MAAHSRPQVNETVAQEKFIERTRKDFTNGVCIGYLRYYDQFQNRRLADLDVYGFIIQNIMDVHDTNPLVTVRVGSRH
jgi:hypothetical protein